MRRPPPNGAAEVAVVLVHGYLCVWPDLYWSGLRPLRQALLARGVPAYTSRQPRTASVASRASRLAGFLDRLPHRRLVLVGHSMGGLDARWAASRLDPAGRVSHVVTLGTPHRGTRLAEWALASPRLRARLTRLLDRGGLRDLTPEGAERLGAAMPDRPDVAYASLAGALDPPDLHPFFRPLGELLEAAEGPNDGLVGIRSAAWGTAGSTVATDHLGLIGATIGPPRQREGAGQALAALRRLVDRAALGSGPALEPHRGGLTYPPTWHTGGRA